MNHQFVVLAVMPLTHTVELWRAEDGKVFYWKLHAPHKISRYSVGMVVTSFIPGGI